MAMMGQEMDPRAMQLMQAAMGGGAPPGMPGGAGPEQGMEPEDDMDEEGHVETALEHIGMALSMPTMSQSERLTLEKATTILQQLLAGREKENDQAMGGSGAMRVLQRKGMAG